jgi:transposase-like protein
MVRGVSCRDYEAIVEQARDGFGVKKSSVSRNFVRASASAVKDLSERRFDGIRFAAIFIDGVEYAGITMICALGVTEDGEKKVLGLRNGGTENAHVVACLLEELRDRGVAIDARQLFVLDGSKALSAGVKRVWGQNAVIQRCQIHKKRNVKAHLPEKHWDEFDRMVNLAYHGSDYEAALKQLELTAKWLDRISPDAAASLREGMEETLTVLRLKVPELLRKTLATTNSIESAFDVCRTVTRRVKRWREGDVRHRWCVACLLKAEERFRRVKAHMEIPALLRSLDRLGVMGPNRDWRVSLKWSGFSTTGGTTFAPGQVFPTAVLSVPEQL